MSGYFVVTMSATCCQAAFSASLPDHMNHFKVTGAADAGVDSPAKPKPSTDKASADARAKRATPPVEPFLMAFPPILPVTMTTVGLAQSHPSFADETFRFLYHA